MALAIIQESPPLQSGDDGVVRVRGTRIGLDILIMAFKEGATPEEILQQLPTLNLGDIYSILGYYLHNQDAVEVYLSELEQQAAALRQQIESQQPAQELRQKLLAQRQASL